jgi:hypothetical protein
MLIRTRRRSLFRRASSCHWRGLPSWAKWQVRDVDILSIKKIPSKASGYCYGKRVLYADAHFFRPLWQELYDSHQKL